MNVATEEIEISREALEHVIRWASRSAVVEAAIEDADDLPFETFGLALERLAIAAMFERAQGGARPCLA